MSLILKEMQIASGVKDDQATFGVRTSYQTCKRNPSCHALLSSADTGGQFRFQDITNTGVRGGKVSNRALGPTQVPRDCAREPVQTNGRFARVCPADSHRATVLGAQAADSREASTKGLASSSAVSVVANAVSVVEDVAAAVDDYSGEILLREFRRELRFLPCQDYLDKQPEVNARMRRVLVGWLARVQSEFKLHRRSLFLAVGIVDRFLSKRQVSRRQFQLVGACSLLIASKVEDFEPPKVNNLVYLSAGEFDENEMKRMESDILRTLDFAVTVPTVADFLPHFQASSQVHRDLGRDVARPPTPALVPFVWHNSSPEKDDVVRNKLSWRLAELTLAGGHMAHYPPSCIAASALLLSSRLSNQHPAWPEVTAELSGYPESALAPCVEDLRTLHSASRRSALGTGRSCR